MVKVYGSTMLGALLFDELLLVFKLGDGEVLLVDGKGPRRLFQAGDKTFDSATASLSMPTSRPCTPCVPRPSFTRNRKASAFIPANRPLVHHVSPAFPL